MDQCSTKRNRMKRINHKSLLALTLAAAPWSLQAQQASRNNTDTTFKTQSLSIYSTYKPEVAPAPKPEFVPSLPVIDTVKPKFAYTVPQQTLSYSYKAEPIKPLAMKQQKETLPFENYIKLGIGNLNTYLIDAGVGGIYGDEYDLNFHFNHLSQKGKPLYQQWSQNTLTAGGSYYFPKHTLDLQLNADRRAYRQYGYDTTVYHYEEDRVKQVYTGVDLQAALTPVSPGFWNIKYQPTVSLYLLNNSMGAKERALGLALPFSKAIDSTVSIGLGVNANLTQYDAGNGVKGNSYLQLTPAVDLAFSRTKVHIGVKPTWAKGNEVYLLPDLTAETVLAKNKGLKLMAGWTSNLEQNTYKNLSTYNPYMLYQYTPVQGTSNKVSAGFDAALNSHFQIGGTVGYKWWKNLAMFANNYTDSTDGRQFDVRYFDASAVNVEARLRYQIHSKFSVWGSSVWNIYNVKGQDKAWHMPQVSISGGLNWNAFPKFNLSAGATLYDRMFANNPDGTYKKLPMIVDINAMASYDVIPRLTLFVQADNILNQKYQLWNQYPVYGINILGGIRFKF
jgi:hypothetical protein